MTRDLSEQRRIDEVEQAGRRMHEFIAMLAHELRNPLAPIRNAVSLMQEPGLSEASRLQATNIIDRQLGQLTRLVDDLLDVSRITSGKIWLRDELIDYPQVIGAQCRIGPRRDRRVRATSSSSRCRTRRSRCTATRPG